MTTRLRQTVTLNHRRRVRPQLRPSPQLQGILWRSSWASVWGVPLRLLPQAVLGCRRTATLPKQVSCVPTPAARAQEPAV